MKRGLLAVLLFASPASAGPLYLGPWSLVTEADPRFALAYMPDVVRSVPATAAGGGGGGTTLPVVDTSTIVKGSADATKLLRFEVDGFTAGATRVITPPDSNTTLPIASQVITFAGPTAARTYTFPDADSTVMTLGNTQTVTGTKSHVDAAFGVVDDGDNTKVLRFQVSALSTATTRTATFQNADGTVPYIGTSQSWTALQTFNSDVNIAFGTANASLIQNDTTNVPDVTKLGAGVTGNSFLVVEQADINSDSGNGPCLAAACTHPTLTIMSATGATTADYSSHSYGGVAGKSVKTLVESSATDTVDVTVAAEAGTAGMYLVSVYATDGSTPQVRMIRVMFAATNDGGTTTCTLGTPEEIDHTPTGTLTATVTCVDGTAALTLQVNAVSDLSQTTLEARSQVILFGPGAILPQ